MVTNTHTSKGTFTVKSGLAQMLKGGVIMDVVNAGHARIAEEAGAKAFVMATSVGAVKGADNYIAAIDFNIKTLAEALK